MNGIRRQLSSSLQSVERKIDNPSSLESLTAAISILDNESTEIGATELRSLGACFREIGLESTPVAVTTGLD